VFRLLTLLGCCLLVACSVLPTVSSEQSVNPQTVNPKTVDQPVPQIKGARGLLSAKQSQDVLRKLRDNGRQSDLLERHLAFEQAVADSPLIAGNAVQLLQDGPSTYQAMFAAIQGARDHINMETYILENDEVGQRFAEALISKQRKGVQVNLIYDSVGTLNTPVEFFERLKESGISLLEFNPINPKNLKRGWEVNQRDHRKLLIVDGKRVFLGGINISSVYSGSSFKRRANDAALSGLPWRDTDLMIDGPVVAEYQKLFLQTWENQHGSTLARRNYFPTLPAQGNSIVHAIGSSPEDPFSQVYVTLVSAINAAARDVLLTTAYFVPDPQLLNSLKAAVARGVEVKLVLPATTDSMLTYYAGSSYYDELLTAGVKLFERQNAFLHSKTALIDGVWSMVGSSNMDWRSFLHNYEVNAVVLGAEFGVRMRKSFDDDVAQSRELSLERWQQRPLAQRMKETLSRLWEYWL
jgi:cardiolipin synthase A/B